MTFSKPEEEKGRERVSFVRGDQPQGKEPRLVRERSGRFHNRILFFVGRRTEGDFESVAQQPRVCVFDGVL